MLHSTIGSSYGYHYDMAVKVDQFIRGGRIDKCESYLRKASYKYREVIDFIKQKGKPLSILEIGCSTGFMTAFLKANGHEVEGVDISERAIRYATARFGSFYSFEPTHENYDLIFHLGLIGCVDDPKRFLSQYFQFLRPGSEMIFNAPNVSSPEQLNELWVSTPPPDLIYLFSEKSFQNLGGGEYNVDIKRVYTGSEVVYKNIVAMFKRRYTEFPQSFSNYRLKSDQRGTRFLVNFFQTKFRSMSGILFHLPIVKRYDNEYGLIVRMSRKGNG